jgi:outer membrane protein TolC
MLRSIAALLLALLTLGRPATASPPVRLSLEEAMRRAEQHAPELGPRRAAMAGTREVRDAAGAVLVAPPRVELGAGPRWRSDDSRTGLELTLGAWLDLPLGRQLGARRRFASALEAEARARLDQAEHDARTLAGLAWIEARLARELVGIRESSLVDAREIARIARARVDAGGAPPEEKSIAEAAAGRAQADLLDAIGKRFVADVRLRHLLGISREAQLELTGPLDAPERPPSRECKSPDLQAAEAASRRSELLADATLAAGGPMLSVGPSATREGTGDWVLLGRVAFPLPLANPNAVEAARARSEALVARAEGESLRRTLERELDLAREERRHSRELRDALASGVVAPAREALRQALAQYAAGRGGTSLVLAARRELLSAEERRAEAAAEVRRADLLLARLLGCDISRSEAVR